MNDERYGVSELADAAGVSVRTVRYYISEGLLPPAVIAGARSYYTADHLDRLRLIGRLKDAFLPLKEIRRQLSQLDDQTVRRIAEEEPLAEEDAVMPMMAPPPTPSAAAAHFIYGHEDIRSDDAAGQPSSASEYIAKILHRTSGRPATNPSKFRAQTPTPAPVAPHASGHDFTPEALSGHVEHGIWRRIAIGDDAELLVREEAYQRRKDKIDWLVSWAKRVIE